MTTETRTLHDDIRELNIAYLTFAIKILNRDKEQAIFQLGIDKKVADFLLNSSIIDLMKLANSGNLLYNFRFDNLKLLEQITNGRPTNDVSHFITTMDIAHKLGQLNA